MQRKIISLFLLIFIVISSFVFAEGIKTLDKKTIGILKKSVKIDAKTKAWINALTSVDARKLVMDRDILNNYDSYFNTEIKHKGITNQQSSGRCWMFAGLNVMRPAVMKKFNLASFEFSQSFLFFWDKLEKANFFLEQIINTRNKGFDDRELQALIADPTGDGAWWNYYVNLIEKYGIVPKSAQPETYNSSHSGTMNRVLKSYLLQTAIKFREMAANGISVKTLRSRKIEALKKVYQLLVMHLGEPVSEFTWKVKNKDNKIIEKKYTPMEFYKDAIQVNLEDYVTVVDYPAYTQNKLYQIKYCTNMEDRGDMTFVNLPISRVKECALKALQNGEPVWFGADVSHDMESKKGIMAKGLYDYASLYGFADQLSKSDRIKYHLSTPNHAMVFVGVDVKNNKPLKWKVENSWGTKGGNGGFWTMYDNWFDEYVYTVIVNKKYLTQDELNLFNTKPIVLPDWDPMRAIFK